MSETTRKIVLKLPQHQRNALVKAACRRGQKLSAFMLEAAFAAASVPVEAPCAHDWVANYVGTGVTCVPFCRLCGAIR